MGKIGADIFGRTTQQTRKIGPRRRARHILRKSSAHDKICGNPTQMWTNLAMLGLVFWSHISRV
jgi:hypothetical protein